MLKDGGKLDLGGKGGGSVQADTAPNIGPYQTDALSSGVFCFVLALK